MNQGDIVLVMFPYTDLENYKIRPALVISGNEFNKHFEHYFCPITTKPPEQGFVISNELAEGTLNNQSYVKTNIIATITEERIIRKIGSITKQKTQEIIQQLKKNFN